MKSDKIGKQPYPRIHAFPKSTNALNFRINIGKASTRFLQEKQSRKLSFKKVYSAHETINQTDGSTTDEVYENEKTMTNPTFDIYYQGKKLFLKKATNDTNKPTRKKNKTYHGSASVRNEKLRWEYKRNNSSQQSRSETRRYQDRNKIRQNLSQASLPKETLASSISKRSDGEGTKTIINRCKFLLREKLSKGENFPVIKRKLLLYMLGLLLLVAMPILLILAIFYNSPFAIFLPTLTGDKTIFTVTTAYTSDFNQQINALVENPSPADTAKIIYTNYEGDAIFPNNYYDIIAVYMVKYGIGNMAAVMDETAEANLKKVFDDMCSYTIEKQVKKPEEDSETAQKIHLIHVTLKSYRDMIAGYEFTKEQIGLVETIMSPQYLAMLTGTVDDANSGTNNAQDIISNITDAEIKTVLNFALSKLGYPYSQPYRDSGNYYDCSSLTYYAWRTVGVDLSYEGSNTAAQQAKLCKDKGYTVSYSNMQPGDLIFYSFGYNGRYKNISHVAMYVGNGMLVDASYSKQKVVYRNVYSRENIVLIGRPGKE